jgi:hypothetical protein
MCTPQVLESIEHHRVLGELALGDAHLLGSARLRAMSWSISSMRCSSFKTTRFATTAPVCMR